MMTTPELQAYIAKERERAARNLKTYEVELFRRSADPFTILILTVIGVSVASRKVRGGVGLHLALGISIGAIFIFLSRFSETFAINQSLPAILGVWLPNIVFGVIAFILFLLAQK
jgi:lipopolysaccharide export system permease protein